MYAFWGLTLIMLTIMFLPLFIEQKKVVHTHEHKYKVSTDFERLWDLLMEGRHIVVFEVDKDGERWPHMAKINKWYDGEITFLGFGLDMNHGKHYTKEDFVNYCKWKKYEYLDQISFENTE
jgi:hypothetical protein